MSDSSESDSNSAKSFVFQDKTSSRDSPPWLLRKNNFRSSSSIGDARREAAWQRRKESFRLRQLSLERGTSMRVTDEEIEELKGCIDLGFSFDPSEPDPKLISTIPALEFYYAVNKQYEDSISRSSSSLTEGSDDGRTLSSGGSASSIFDEGIVLMEGDFNDPKTLKTKIKHWAKVVACMVRQNPPKK